MWGPRRLLPGLLALTALFTRAEFNFPSMEQNVIPEGLVFNGDAKMEWCLESCADIIPEGYITAYWHDAWSNQQNCEWYAMDAIRCPRYGRYYRNMGLTANEACCTCGGGYKYINTSNPEKTEIKYDSTDHYKVHASELDPQYKRDCMVALRLTEAKPDQTSSVWHETRQTVFDGFETRFTFRISNRSLFCEKAERKNDAKQVIWQFCKENLSPILKSKYEGGDGFAFVIQNHKNETHAIGEGAGGLGFTGLENTLAVEFDTYSNAGEPDFPHISIRAAGVGQMNNAYQTSSVNTFSSDGGIRHTSWETELAPAVPGDFANGYVHTVRIVLYRGVKFEFLEAYGATQNLARFTKGKLLSLCVFLDNLTAPRICVPFHIYSLVPLINNQAYVGFTASTGRQWQAIDIMSWRLCESGECN